MSELSLEETKQNLQKTFLTFKSKNTALQFECDYLRKHISLDNLPAPSQNLLDLQERTLLLASKCTTLLEKYNMQYFLFANALVGYARHKGNLCPWDDCIQFGLMADNFWELVGILRKEKILFETGHFINHKDQQDKNLQFFSFLDTIFSDNILPHSYSFFAILTPFSLQIYNGTSLENHASIDILPWYYWKNTATSRDYLSHAKNVRTQVENCNKWHNIFTLYEKEHVANHLYASESDIIAAGIGSYILTNAKFSGFFPKDKLFPLQKIHLQGQKFNTFNDIEAYLSSNYGDYMQLPRDVGITTKSSVVEEYLKLKQRTLNMPEASFICKH